MFEPRHEVEAPPPTRPRSSHRWLDEIRAGIDEPGEYLAFKGVDGDERLLSIPTGWTRIGRSGAADILFDDATVSRRHALIVRTPEDELKALDDRSLNGLLVNGERVEWTRLGDGDVVEIGRYRLHVIVV